MPIYSLDGIRPRIANDKRFWIAPDAVLIGNVTVGEDVTIWFGAVIRGDNDPIIIGDGTNIQDGAVLHTDPGFPLHIGNNVTVGHRAIIHGCTIEAGSLIGMGATVLSGAHIGENCLIGANTLVKAGAVIADCSLVVGNPGRVVRELGSDELTNMKGAAVRYVRKIGTYRDTLLKRDRL
ncbi:gamma carbonic anhydrase family protein [Mesorhizobium escarrei]|uniref:Gamma carbonic anhydrase family protein n=1 Tax=Mesorhizobium escarrei TaxID=666018 RepID=A0ABM9DHY3_9HYPH|nr:gamma carbonic anhydrase family protein [Mesorhizobium escarrei]CAH2396188.1 Gamma carbonic anhydrase family protein [Mesorhizobium escarrei]